MPRRRRRLWWIGLVVAAALLGALAGLGPALVLAGLAALFVGLVAVISPRWVGARRRRAAGAIAAVGLAAMITGTVVAPLASTAGPETVPPAASAEPSTPATPDEPTASPTSTPTEARDGTAFAAVDQLRVKGRAPKTGYDRSEYGDGWARADGCTTREMILRRDLDDVTVQAAEPCGVVAGTLHDPYTGQSTQLDPDSMSTADIDHVVAVSDSWQKGAQQWDRSKRIRFYNDPLNLLTTTGAANASKGDGDAATWLPPDKDFRCEYVARQVSVKIKYDLWVTAAEQEAMTRVLRTCPDQLLITTRQAKKVVDRTPTVQPTESESGKSAATDPRYPTCAAANRAGLGPYVRGVDPEYEWYRDQDRDGVVCERWS